MKIWDAKSGKEIMTLTGHSDRVLSCAYSPDGLRIVSGSGDNTLKIWDAKTGNEQAAFVCEAKVTAVAFSPCGKKIVMGDYSGIVYYFDLAGFVIGTPLLTGVRLLINGEADSTGTLAPDISTFCPFCGVCFPLSAPLLDTIAALNRDYPIGPDDSPCLKLPAEAWDDPHLLSECPNCHKPLKFNPFVVDNRDQY